MKKDGIIRDGDSVPAERGGRKWLVRIAAIAVGAIILTSGILMLNANVRDAVLGVFSGWGDDSLYRVKIGYIPKGFTADRENVLVRYGEYDDPTSRGITFVQESDLDYWNEPWAAEIDEYRGYHPPRIEISICRPGSVNEIEDLSEFPGVTPEEITVRGIRGQMAHTGTYEIREEQDDVADSYWVLFRDEDVTVFIQSSGIDLDEVMKIAEGIKW
ncbi:MAG: hypothetical protein IJM71_07685 [Clostridia bacterium]|nr:hypothetical protein [Clostridia bacterium]